ncbi:FAD-dependent monooxygenase [Streptomyces sp. UNOC14_S4]|nr:FAD-dependent monooxygenase [Streptomyces sp. UNOC14_S4]
MDTDVTASEGAGVGTETEVLIAGAGPTGLVLAIDLARRGVRPRVVERSERGFPGSRGAALQPRTLEVLDDLGMLETFQAAGGPCQPVQNWQGTERVGTWELVERSEPTPAEPYPNILMIPQWRTVELLYTKLEEMGVRVEFNTELTGFTQEEGEDGNEDGDGNRNGPGVTAELRHADGSTETVRAGYLVAADGGRSTVRKVLGTPFEGTPIDDRPALLADFRMEGLDRDHWHMWPKAPGGMVALRPLEGMRGLFQLIARFDDKRVVDLESEATAESLIRLIEERTGLSGLSLSDVSWSSAFKPYAAMAEHFRVGRVLLAGDAAHVHSPSGGQGLNTSVQDAYNLGWKLAAVLRQGAPESVLDSYDAERTRVAAGVLSLSTRQFATDNASENGFSQRGRATRQLDLHYRESPLTREARRQVPESALHAGDRAPDAPCHDSTGTPVRLFDLFRGPHFTLLDLTVKGAALPTAPWLRAYRVNGPEADVLDTHGHAESTYGKALFLIRPDGYVALATEDPEDVREYVESWGPVSIPA